jgi:hypothetical protein
VAHTRLDPLDCARTIVLGCLERDFCSANTSNGDPCNNTILSFERYRPRSRAISPTEPTPQPGTVKITPPKRESLRSVAMTILSILSCIVVAIWLFAFLTIRA